MSYDWSASGGFSARPNYDLYLYVRRDQTDAANNRSTYAFQLAARWLSGSPRAFTGAVSSGRVAIGSGAWDFTGVLDFRSTDLIILGSGVTGWISHASDGTLNIFPSATWSSDNFGNAALSGTFATDPISSPGSKPETPAAPTLLEGGLTSLKLGWVIPASGTPINQMLLRRYTNPAGTGAYVDYVNSGSATSRLVTGLTIATDYYWAVYARNSAGYSPRSPLLATRTAARARVPKGGVYVPSLQVMVPKGGVYVPATAVKVPKGGVYVHAI